MWLILLIWKSRVEGFGINRYALLYIKQINNEDVLYSTATQYFIITYGGKNLKKNICMYMCIIWIILLYTWN